MLFAIQRYRFYPPGCWLALLTMTALVGSAVADEPEPRTESRPVLRPHPEAIANTHDPSEVDKPELVPFIVKDSRALPGIVVDEMEAKLVGKWQYSTHTPPYVGLGYLHDQKSGKGERSVIFTPNLPAEGLYEVRLSHCYNVRRSTNTPVTIHFADGERTIRINQQETPPHGRLFRTLGTFRFEAGKQGWVRISNEGTDGKYVIADAVQFLPVRK
ncbi:MAG: xanthan lyase [Planctomycetales bacterium]|nr:xanthan lyase [Planctomycetales bacterium]